MGWIFCLLVVCIVPMAFSIGPDCSKIANTRSCCSAAVISRCAQRCAPDAAVHCPALLQRVMVHRNDSNHLLRRKPSYSSRAAALQQQAVQAAAQSHEGPIEITAPEQLQQTAADGGTMEKTENGELEFKEESYDYPLLEDETTPVINTNPPSTPPTPKSASFERDNEEPQSELMVTSSPNEHFHEITSVQLDTLQQNCGTKNVSFQPCIEVKIANGIFEQCCAQFVDTECQSLCRYALQREDAKGMLLSAISERRCSLRNLNSVLHCAAQNSDNRECCRWATTAGLLTGACSDRFCDPLYGIGQLTPADLSCLANWHRIMFCHLSGLR